MSPPRVRVCLTFDLDAMSVWLAASDRMLPTVLSRGEYGARVGAPRLLDLLRRYGIRTTWFVPGHTADTHPDLVRRVHADSHELGYHGYCHEAPSGLGAERERRVLERGIEILKRISGRAPAGYRAPMWDLSPHTIPLLIEHGFRYDSSMSMGDYYLHRARIGDEAPPDSAFRFGQESPLVEVPVNWSLDDFEYFAYVPAGAGTSSQQGGKLPEEVFEVWAAEFDYMYEHCPGGTLTYTMHPQVSGRGPRVLMLERLIRHIRQHPDVELGTVGEAVDAWLASPAAQGTGVA